MENKSVKTDQSKEYGQQNLKEIKEISKGAMAQFHALFRTSLEKLKQYGVSQGMLEPDTPLEQVRQKLIEKIKELDERKTQRRTETAEFAEKERRKTKDRR